MKINKRTIFITAVFLAGSLAAFGCTGRSMDLTTSEAQTARTESQPLPDSIIASGTARARQSAWLTWQTTGTVETVRVGVGEQVSAGHELAVLDPASLPQSVILAQANLVKAEQALEELLNSQRQQAQAFLAVEQAQQALDDLLHPEMAQAQALQDIAAAQQAVDDAKMQVYILTTPPSQSTIDHARANLLLADNQLNNTRQQLEKMRKQIKSLAQLPASMRSSLRGTIQNGIEMLEVKLNQDQMAVDRSTEKINDLLAPANPTDLAMAQSALAAAEAKLAQAQREYDLLKDGYSQADIDLAKARLSDAQRQWERVKDGPNSDDVAAAQARVAAAEAALAQVRLTAPFDGVITRLANQPGDVVSPGDLALRLDDLSHLLVDAQVSEVDINQVYPGQSAILTFDGILGQKYHGTVVEVAPVGIVTDGVVTFEVTIELTDADPSVHPGMTAAVEIAADPVTDESSSP